MNYEKEILIDESALDVEWLEQPRLMMRYTRHAAETGSRKAADILQHWAEEKANFVQVCPKEMLDKLAHPLGIEETAVPAE